MFSWLYFETSQDVSSPVQPSEHSTPFLFDHLGLCFWCCLCFLILCNKPRNPTSGTLCPFCTTFSCLNFPLVLLLIPCIEPRRLTAGISFFYLIISPVPCLFLTFLRSPLSNCTCTTHLCYTIFVFGTVLSFLWLSIFFVFFFCLLFVALWGLFLSSGSFTDTMPLLPLSLGGGTGLVFVFRTHCCKHRTHRAPSCTHSDVHKCVQSCTYSDIHDIHKCVQTKANHDDFKLLLKIFFLETVITIATLSGEIYPVDLMPWLQNIFYVKYDRIFFCLKTSCRLNDLVTKHLLWCKNITI